MMDFRRMLFKLLFLEKFALYVSVSRSLLCINMFIHYLIIVSVGAAVSVSGTWQKSQGSQQEMELFSDKCVVHVRDDDVSIVSLLILVYLTV